MNLKSAALNCAPLTLSLGLVTLSLCACTQRGASPPSPATSAAPPAVAYEAHVDAGGNVPPGGTLRNPHDGDAAVANAEAHLDKIIRLLKASGVDFPGNNNMKFGHLDPLTGASLIHAEGEWINGDKNERRVTVSVGPEVGNVTAMQVEEVIRDANRKGYDDLVFAGFGFDAEAQDAIESGSHPKLRLHMALIRPDVAMGDLLKTQPGSQLFTVFSAPRVKVRQSKRTASSRSRSRAWMSMIR